MALDAIPVTAGQVDASPGALHDGRRCHDAARHRHQAVIHHVGDQQLVGREVALLLAVVPDVYGLERPAIGILMACPNG
jgi:hypothetical protein